MIIRPADALRDAAPPVRSGSRGGRRLRRLATAVAAASVAAVWLAADVYGGGRSVHEVVRVRPGDTVWAIAAAHYGDGDVRRHVADIISSNHLEGGYLISGTTLVLPGS